MSNYRVALQATVTVFMDVELSDRELLEFGIIKPDCLKARFMAAAKGIDNPPTISVEGGVHSVDVSHWYTPSWEDKDEVNAEYVPTF